MRTDLLVHVGVRNEFTEAMNADFHDSGSPSPFLCLGRHNSLFPSSHAMAQFSPSQDPASSCVALPTWINGWDSAQARSSTSPNSSVGCAPDTPYRSSTAKKGTPPIQRLSPAARPLAPHRHTHHCSGRRVLHLHRYQSRRRVAVSIERIAILRLSQVILQPLLGRNGAHPLIRRRGLREMHAVFLRQDLVDRLPWVKLVAASGDLDLLAMRKVGQGRLKAALADVTPGAGHVRPDFYFHEFLTSCLSLSLADCLGRELWTSPREGATAAGRLMRMPMASTSRAATASTPNNSACGRLIPKRVSSE